jgi:hypothetical protein
MRLVGLANPGNPFHGVFFADPATQRVAGIRRIGDYPALTEYFDGAPNQPRLRRDGMNFEILAHDARIRLVSRLSGRLAVSPA